MNDSHTHPEDKLRPDPTDPGADPSAPISWRRGVLRLLDQRLLPAETAYLELTDWRAAGQAITDLVVRGAPAIGVTAAYALVLAAIEDPDGLPDAADGLAAARPTAVNLRWALDLLRQEWDRSGRNVDALEAAARQLHVRTLQDDLAMAALGSDLLPECSRILTHCNTGALATGGFGTALGVIKQAFIDGKVEFVYASETRPWWQGARLTAWELQQAGIPFELVTEGAVAHLMAQGHVNSVIVGSDRIVANGDVANKIGTYSAALNAYMHGVDFHVAAPTSTIDPHTPDGSGVPVEQRTDEEVLVVKGQRMAPEGAKAWNPVFDITPARYVSSIITEKAVLRAPYGAAIAGLNLG